MRVKEVMIAHNLTWATLATKTGKSSSSFIQVANGNPTIGKLKETADAIGCNWLEFFTDELTEKDLEKMLEIVRNRDNQQQAVEQAKENDQPSSALTADVAFICPHCHEAIKLGFVK